MVDRYVAIDGQLVLLKRKVARSGQRAYWLDCRRGIWRVCWSHERRKRARSARTTDHTRAMEVLKSVALCSLRRDTTEPKRAWLRRVLARTRCNAATRGIAFDLTAEDLASIFEDRCAVTHIPFDFVTPRSPWSPTIDRIDAGRGYVSGNCRFVCKAVNYAMNEWGEGVFWTIVDAVANQLSRYRHAV